MKTSPLSLSPLGFTLDHGVNDRMQLMIFDSLQVENIFNYERPWIFYLAFPFSISGAPAFSNENEEGSAKPWKVIARAHNSVVRIAPCLRFSVITQQC